MEVHAKFCSSQFSVTLSRAALFSRSSTNVVPRVTAVFLILFLTIAHHAHAAITVNESTVNGITVIFVRGVIDFGDEIRFTNAIGNTRGAIVLLESPGGSPIAAIEIG